MSESNPGKVKPKTMILGVASGLAALALAILAGWLIMKRVGEPQVARLTQDPATENTAPATSTEPQAAAPAEAPATKAPAEQAGAPQTAPQANAAAPEPAAPAAAEEPKMEAAATGDAPADAQTQAADGATTIELARVEPSGDAVFAGTTGPDAKVELYAGGAKVGESSSDSSGNWAVVLDKQLPAGSSDVYAVVTDKAGKTTRSIESIAVVIDSSKKVQPLIVAQTDDGSRVIQNPAKSQGSDKTESPAAQAQSTDAPAAAEPVEVASAEPAAQQASPTPQLEANGSSVAQTPAAPSETPAAATSTAQEAPAAESAVQVATAPAASEAVEPVAPQPVAPKTVAPATETAPAAGSASPVSIEAADYDTTGRLSVSGRAAPGATVRLYYDNEHVGDAVADASGFWSLSVNRQLDDAVHAVRADVLAPGTADVAGRAEVSFIAALPESEEKKLAAATTSGGGAESAAAVTSQSAAAQEPASTSTTTTVASQQPAASGQQQQSAATTSDSVEPSASSTTEVQVAAANTAQTADNPNRITVERGDNLWRLARDLYGRGVRYTTIYDANRDQIRNPDLIFPGQVFLLPRVNDTSETAAN